ncbi:MAG: hypothetical protein KAH38_03840 [Candidatus Hydrogenedentes bacterium]|nr:hypothetical protein [Candidatus Hydrogenedentota bacterium]
MDIQLLTNFFMWCTIINGTVLLLWSIPVLFLPDLIYRTQKRWFPGSRETFGVVLYCFLGLFKVIFIFFSLTPFIALLIIG